VEAVNVNDFEVVAVPMANFCAVRNWV